MKKIIIYGVSDFARQLKYYLDRDRTYQIVGFCQDDGYNSVESYEGLPVYSFTEAKKFTEVEFLIAVGYSKMNKNREAIYNRLKKSGCRIASYIHPTAVVQSNSIGEGNIILENTVVEPFAKIGHGNLIWYNVSVAHGNIIGNFNNIAGNASLCGNVIVHNNCFIGNNACVKEGVTVSDYTLIGAQVYMPHDTKEGEVYKAPKGVLLKGKSDEYI